MGSVFSNISQSMPSMPNMSGVKSYFDPTAPPQGFSDTRSSIAAKGSTVVELGRKFKNLRNVKNAKSLVTAGLNLQYAAKGVQFAYGNREYKIPKKQKEGYKNPLAEKKSFSESIKNQAEGLAMLSTLKGRIKENVKSRQKPELPPIEPKGEFATMFGNFMRLVRLETITRENFIETFIQKILEIGNNNNRNELKKLNELLEIFKKLKDELINKSLTKIETDKLDKLENKIKEIKKNRNDETYFNGLSNNSKIDSKKNMNEEIKKIEEQANPIKIFINKIHDIIKKSNYDKKELVKELSQKKIFIKEEDITPQRIFIELHLDSFKKKIDEEIEKIKKQKINVTENMITNEEKMVQKIQPIISSHKGILNNLNQILEKVTEKDDYDKLLKMGIILEKIISKNVNGYYKELQLYGNNNSKGDMFTGRISKFFQKIQDFYEKQPKKNPKNTLEKTREYYSEKGKIEKEIKEFDMIKLQSILNELLAEYYTKYKIYTINGKPPTISGEVPQLKNTAIPVSRSGSLKYSDLSKKINIIFAKIPSGNKNKNKTAYMDLLKLKVIIDEFMTRMGGTNFEKTKYDLFSSKINFDLKEKMKIPDFENEFSRLKEENRVKSIQDLQKDANDLLDKFSKFLPNNNKNSRIGKINNSKKEVKVNS